MMYGVEKARRALPADPTEEAIVLDPEDYARVPVEDLTRALMNVLPNMKGWVVPESGIGASEAI